MPIRLTPPVFRLSAFCMARYLSGSKPAAGSTRTSKARPGRALLFLLCLIVLCLVSNMLQVFIDTPSLRENAREAVERIGIQESVPELVGGFSATRLDNFTSVLILKTAAYTGGESFWLRAFGGMRYERQPEDGEDAWLTFCTYDDGRNSPTGGLSYSRYWHGYILPLRLLLAFTSYSNIQILFYAVILGLTAGCIALFTRRGLTLALPGFCVSLFLMVPAALGICIQYVPVSLVALLSVLLLLLFYERIRDGISLSAFFAASGILTCYLDLLTFPMLALGLPLVTLVLLEADQYTPWQMFLRTFRAACFWMIGFLGIWMLKFGINALLFGLWDSMSVTRQIQLRMSTSSGEISYSRLTSFFRNLHVILDKRAYHVLYLGFLLCEVIRIFRARRAGTLSLCPQAFSLLIPLVIPVLWMLMTSNHVYDHYYYTYRDLGGTIFAGIAFLHLFFRTGRPSTQPA